MYDKIGMIELVVDQSLIEALIEGKICLLLLLIAITNILVQANISLIFLFVVKSLGIWPLYITETYPSSSSDTRLSISVTTSNLLASNPPWHMRNAAKCHFGSLSLF